MKLTLTAEATSEESQDLIYDVRTRVDEFISLIENINSKLERIEQKERQQQMTLDQIISKVAEQTTVVESANTLLAALAAEIRAAAGDPVKLEALASRIESNTQSLADAIATNTPVAPPVPVEGKRS